MAPAKRLYMKDWLRQLLDTGSNLGISWENKQEETFKIDWKHGSRHGYDSSRDAYVFRAWAKYTGKFEEFGGPDPKRWKANFRCALNSLRDVVQVETRHDRGANASRTYRFVNREKSRKKMAATSRAAEKPKCPRNKNIPDTFGSRNENSNAISAQSLCETAVIQLPPFQHKFIKCERLMTSGMDDNTLYGNKYNVTMLTPPSSPDYPDFCYPLTTTSDMSGDQKVPVQQLEYNGLTAIAESQYSLDTQNSISSSIGTGEFEYMDEGINFTDTDLQISTELDIISSNISWVTLHEIMTSDI